VSLGDNRASRELSPSIDAKAIFHQLSLATRPTTEPTAPQPRAVFADTKAFIETWRHYFRLARDSGAVAKSYRRNPATPPPKSMAYRMPLAGILYFPTKLRFIGTNLTGSAQSSGHAPRLASSCNLQDLCASTSQNRGNSLR